MPSVTDATCTEAIPPQHLQCAIQCIRHLHCVSPPSGRTSSTGNHTQLLLSMLNQALHGTKEMQVFFIFCCECASAHAAVSRMKRFLQEICACGVQPPGRTEATCPLRWELAKHIILLLQHISTADEKLLCYRHILQHVPDILPSCDSRSGYALSEAVMDFLVCHPRQEDISSTFMIFMKFLCTSLLPTSKRTLLVLLRRRLHGTVPKHPLLHVQDQQLTGHRCYCWHMPLPGMRLVMFLHF